MRVQQGVTLIEASVVVAVTAIGLSTATSGFHRLIETQRLEAAAAQLAGDLQYARSQAVLGQRALRLSLRSTSDGSCYVVHSGAADACDCSASGPARCEGEAREIKTVQWPASEGVALRSAVGSMLFDPLHGTSTPAGTLEVVARSGRTIRHVVNVMGRVRSCTPSDAASAVAGLRAC